MKPSRITAFVLCLLMACASVPVSAQDSAMNKKNSGMRVKMDKNKVPKVVTESFYKEYPSVTYEDWYGYPAYDNALGWYEYDPTYYSSDYPGSYVVEFTHNDTTNKTIYDKSGKKIATHQSMKMMLPEAVTDSIKDGMYKSWTMGKDKEEIFKDSYADKMKVYRVSVMNGSQKHTLYYQQNGTLLKDKKVS
jgi:hypothetical protein